jgi:hypothetical protein
MMSREDLMQTIDAPELPGTPEGNGENAVNQEHTEIMDNVVAQTGIATDEYRAYLAYCREGLDIFYTTGSHEQFISQHHAWMSTLDGTMKS